MSSASFNPRGFIMHLDPDLLEQFSQNRGIDFEVQEDEESEQTADRFLAALERLGEQRQGEIWAEFHEVDDLASQKGSEYLINRAVVSGVEISEAEIEELKSIYDRSFWFYLNHKEIFDETISEYELDYITGWRKLKTISKDKQSVLGNIVRFEEALQEYYQAEYKGKHCKVKVYEREERIYFVAFIEDNYTNEVAFEGNNLNQQKPRKPVFEAFFLYRPDEGVLEVKVKGGRQKVKDMQELFLEHILENAQELDEPLPTYDFDRFKNLSDLTFDTDPTDGVEFVQLKSLRFYDSRTKTKISLDIGDSDEYGTQAMQNTVNAYNIDLYEFLISQAVILVKFKKEKKRGRAKQVTVRITYPNSCDLKERKEDRKVRELLKRWEIDII